RIIGRGNTIRSLSDDPLLLHDNGSERTSFAGTYVLQRQGDSLAHEFCRHDDVNVRVRIVLPALKSQPGYFPMRRIIQRFERPSADACARGLARNGKGGRMSS